MKKPRLLIVDDSVLFRRQIKLALGSEERLEIVGSAPNGKIALDRLVQNDVDLMLLDLEMPDMNGIETLKAMKDRGLFHTKVIVFSSRSQRGATITLEALSLGATDFALKPGADSAGETPEGAIREAILQKIYDTLDMPNKPAPVKALASTAPPTAEPVRGPNANRNWVKPNLAQLRPKIIIIGSSTGGPNALEAVFTGITAPTSVPICIVQHMPPLFTASLAARIGNITGIEAAEAKDGEQILPNRIYMAPGGYHLGLEKRANGTFAKLNQGPMRNSVRPAVDTLFEDASEIYREGCCAFVLTGMGSDGLVGAYAVKDNGGFMMIQDRASCVVFGMPGAIHAVNAYDRMGNLTEVRTAMMDLLRNAAAFDRSHK